MESIVTLADIALGSVYVLFPNLILELQGAVTEIDGVHSHMTRALGSVWLSGSLKQLLFTRTKPSVALSAHGAARFIALLTVLLNTLHGVHASPRVFNSQLPLYDLLVFGFFIISAILTTRGQGTPSLNQSAGDPSIPFLRIDFLATFIFGLLWLAYPDWLLRFQVFSPPDPLHLHITRAFGAMMVGDSLVSLAVQWSTSRQDKMTVFKVRTAATTVLLLSMLWTHNTTPAWTVAHVWFGMLGCLLWIGNSVLGYLKTAQDKKSV